MLISVPGMMPKLPMPSMTVTSRRTSLGLGEMPKIVSKYVLVSTRFIMTLTVTQSLEIRADKHLARQNDILLLAVARVWKARERGKLLQRVRSVRLIKEAWSAWRARMDKQRQLEGKCVSS